MSSLDCLRSNLHCVSVPTFLPHSTPKFLVSKGKKKLPQQRRLSFLTGLDEFSRCHLWLQSNHLYIYWTSLKRKKKKVLLEDEGDNFKCAFSVHQVSECSVQNCQGTDHWVLSTSSEFYFITNISTPLTSPPDPSTWRRSCPGWEINALKGTARSEHAAASAHKPRAIPALFSSFHRSADASPQPIPADTPEPSSDSQEALPQYLLLSYHLPVRRSTKDLKLFPILSWISAESSEKKRN